MPVADDRYWASWADWMNVPPHPVRARETVVAQGTDNAEALRLVRPGH